MTLTNNVGQEVNATTLTDGNGVTPVIDEVNGKMTFTLGGDLGIDMIAKAYFEPISHGGQRLKTVPCSSLGLTGRRQCPRRIREAMY